MALRDTFLNMLGVEAQEVQKTDNSVYKSARDFLRNGSRERLYPTWSDIKMSDSDMYRGYSYAVIQKRGNKVASLAKNNLKTYAKSEIVDEFQKKNEIVWHPYLKLIEDSTKFTEKQFWKNISIYLDLAGRYYLGVIRNEVKSLNPKLPTITTDPTEFIMLNPYEIRRVVDKDGQVAGYIERKKDGRYREWPLYQIIEIRELNPFDPDNSQWAMTDAAKNAVYTINQSGDYTRQSLNGNIDAPGIITTDVLLNDEDFANFRARVTQHTKGEPLFGNGTGAIKWDSMQIDLDKAALLDINEINRTELFAVSGTSKTSLGIEQSGTTRETARVQSEQFVSDTAQPRLEDIVDFLNLDYKKHYKREYDKTGYKIEVESAVGKDYDTEQKAVALKQSQFELATQLIQAGYTIESAYQFAEGEIDFADLELEKGVERPRNPDEPEDPNENSPTSPKKGPQSGSDGGDDKSIVSDEKAPQNANTKATDLNNLVPHDELVTNGGKGSGNFGHAGRLGEVGGSSSTGAIISKIKTHCKTFTFGDQKYRAVTAEHAIYPDILLVEGEGRNEAGERTILVGYLDNYPDDREVGRALHFMQLKSLGDLAGGDESEWEIIKEHLAAMDKREQAETKKKNEVECTCKHENGVEHILEQSDAVKEGYDRFLAEIRAIEKETIDATARKVEVNSFEMSDIIGKRKRKTLTEKLKNAIHDYWWIIFPLLANQTTQKRNTEFQKDAVFVFTNELQAGVDDNALRVAEGHMETILNDVLDAANRAYTNVTEEAAANLIVEAYEKNPDKFSSWFTEVPTRADALASIRKTDILDRNRSIYEKANKMAWDGYDRRQIIKAIREEYSDISEKRATVIARNETSRAFTRSQYEADKQFLNTIGKMDVAYKQLVSRRPDNETDKICPVCWELINRGPVPFEEPFLRYGESIEITDGDKIRTFTANYEDIDGGVCHVGCMCYYELVFKNDAGEFVKTLNGVEHGENNNLGGDSADSRVDGDHSNAPTAKSLNGGPGSGNFGHAGRPGEIGGSSKDRVFYGEKIYLSSTIYDLYKKAKTQDDVENLKQAMFREGYAKEKMTRLLLEVNDRLEKQRRKKELIEKNNTPERNKAVEEITKKIKGFREGERWFRQSVSPEMAIAINEELDKAMEDGVDVSNLELSVKSLGRYGGKTVSDSNQCCIVLNKDILYDTEYTQKAYTELLKEKYFFADDLGRTMRHELGHYKSWQTWKKSGLKAEYYPAMERYIVTKARNALTESDISALRKDPYKFMSGYGQSTNSNGMPKFEEMIAESYCTPNHGKLMKNIDKALRNFSVQEMSKDLNIPLEKMLII